MTTPDTPQGSPSGAASAPDLDAEMRRLAEIIPAPVTVAETGLPLAVLTDLMLKAMFQGVRATPVGLSDLLHLERPVIDELLDYMRNESLVAVTGQATTLQAFYELTQRGRTFSSEAFQRSGYVGPAPVPFEHYVETQSHQSVATISFGPDDIRRVLSSLVQPAWLVDAIGAAVMSAESLLLYGPSGNGKSTVASLLRALLSGIVAIPYAIDVDGHAIRVYDARLHEPPIQAAPSQTTAEQGGPRHGFDRRYEPCRRPLVTLGSELALEHLELKYSAGGSYVAPPQLKANGGILVVDDLGRQMVRAEELLNRWIGPMSLGSDHLVLQTGELIRVPFDVMLIFATNLDPHELGDEAFERRIRHKVLIGSPTEEEFLAIMRRECASAGVPYDEATAELFVHEFCQVEGRVLRGSYPGDILRNLADFARFRGLPPRMTFDRMREAASAMFVTSTS